MSKSIHRRQTARQDLVDIFPWPVSAQAREAETKLPNIMETRAIQHFL